MANCADKQGLREILGDKMYEDYFGETIKGVEKQSQLVLAVLQSSKLPAVKTLRDRLLSYTDTKKTTCTQTWINIGSIHGESPGR